MKKKIWLSSPHMSGEEMPFIEEAFSKNFVFPLGPNVSGLEKDIVNLTGCGNCTCLSSGTAAIHLALILLGVSSGDEVICSSFTFSASANPIVYCGATPVFVDSESSTWNMDPGLLECTIKDRIKIGKIPKAIIVVHLYGMPARMDEIMTIAASYKIPVIEDAAEALGSRYRDKYCGTWGDIGIYSFNGNKIITTSGGGALVSSNKEFCDKALFFATQARDKAPHYQHSFIGYNYRMSNISAGIGRGQMKVLDDRVQKRRENFLFYKNELDSIDGISFLEEPDQNFYSNHWLTTIVVDPGKTGNLTADDLGMILQSKNIECRPLWKPMSMQPVFSSAPSYEYGIARSLFHSGLCLPSSSNITDDERNFVVETILQFFSNNIGRSYDKFESGKVHI